MMTDTFLSFFEISISVSLIIAVLILFTSFFNKRYAVKWKYFIWIVLALRLLIPFKGTDVQSMVTMLSQRWAQTAAESENDHVTPLPDTTAPGRIVVEIPAQMTRTIMAQSETSNPGITLLDAVAWIWALGSLAFLLIHLFSYLCYKRQVTKRGTAIRELHILRQIAELKRELRIKGTINIVEYDGASSPMVIGFLKPVLILPEVQYNAEELYFILKHELVHFKRKDVYFKLLFLAANAVHWFNPLIWIMQKEAAVDMEQSCDERVTQGADYAVRKAYTETLLSTLHKQCVKKTILSTQFYGGKKIMKKRFQNILIKNGKRNGISILICAVILTVSLGTMVGCSVNKPDHKIFAVPDIVVEKAEELIAGWCLNEQANHAEYSYTDWRIESLAHCYTYEDFEGMVLQIYQLNHEFLSDKPENILLAGGMNVTDDGWVTADYPNSRFLVFRQNGETLSFLACLFENDCFPGDELFSEDLKNLLVDLGALAIADNDEAENETLLTFSKEGEIEQKQASLVAGNGFSFYLPDGEWQQTGPDLWSPIVNESVSLWITHFEGAAIGKIAENFMDDGYVTAEDKMWKQSGELIYNVELKEFENDVWSVCYCYPVDAEEGWGRELPVIADTFAVTASVYDGQNGNSGPENFSSYLGEEDRQEIRNIVDKFAEAYFGGDANTIQKFLVSNYEWNIDTYEGTGTITDLTVKGLSDADEYRSEGGNYIVSLEFRDSENDDTFWYLTFEFVKQEDGWKIRSYGVEG